MSASSSGGLRGYFDLRPERRTADMAAADIAAADAAGAGTAAGAVEVALPAWRENLAMGLAYVAQVLGVVGKQVYDDLMQGRGLRFHLPTLVLAAIISAVTFPTVYRTLEAQTHDGLRLFLAFQNGFFWQSVLGQVAPNA